MEQLKQFKNLGNKIVLRKIRLAGIMISSIMSLLNTYVHELTGSLISEIGMLVSLIGLLYFSFDYKGY